jgi:hypothetical protein
VDNPADAAERKAQYITSIYIEPDDLERKNNELLENMEVKKNVTRVETFNTEDAEVVINAFEPPAHLQKCIRQAEEKESKSVCPPLPVAVPFGGSGRSRLSTRKGI